ncbi:unnamed protein product [Mytilus edulis]|uniref:Fibronectin type-III domain-containing protein n=1 Tax=Mytilus edulis TaxID=6550 RepID=A0A8S3PVU2_MYTED|nr:unnamed protein product [Mytilus edulis]
MIVIFTTTLVQDVKREIDVLSDIANQQYPVSLRVTFGRKGDAPNLIKKRELIPCFHETQPSGCSRPGCPFKHSKLDPTTRYKYEDTLSATHAMAPVETGSDFLKPSSSPSAPICLVCTSNSIMLSWTEPDNTNGNINEYKIVFREYSTSRSRWKSATTKSKQTVCTVNGLKAKTQEYHFGKKIPGSSGKTIMLVGASGSGKSALLDGMINYIFGVSWDDNFRLTMVELSDAEKTRYTDQTKSQTEWITIDTPGFGNTRDLVRDIDIVDKMKEFIKSRESQRNMKLDGLCFVVQAPLVRLTTPQISSFNAILSLFDQNFVNNIYVLITFADGNKPLVLDALQGAKVPFKKFYKFNNSALFVSTQDSQESEFGSLYWKMGMESFRLFFDDLQCAQTKSSQKTKQK